MAKERCIYCTNMIDSDNKKFCKYCGKRSIDYKPAPHHLRPGTILNGKYFVGAVIGEGGFGITYIGRDINLDLKIAIKEYFPSGAVNRNNTYSAEITANFGESENYFTKGKESFLNEARALAKFSTEPNCVSVRDFFEANNTAYIVMEYLDGIDLKSYVEEHGKLSFEEMFTLLNPIMNVLGKMHSTGLIHRDISPSNITILNDGKVKLLDFGAARVVEQNNEKSLSIMLKPGYAPEEQYRTKGHQGTWTDVYALSATMYKLLTGVTPEDAMNRLFSDELKRITELNTSVTPAQEAVILKGMSVEQENRYQTIAELQSACAASIKSNKNDNLNHEDEKTVGAFSDSNISNSNNLNQEAKPYAYPETSEKNFDREKLQGDDKKKADKKSNKKPNIPCFIFSFISGILALILGLSVVISIENEKSFVFSLIVALLFGGLSVFLGKFYYPRVNNKERKPNIVCLILSIIMLLAAVFMLILSYLSNANGNAEDWAIPCWIFTAAEEIFMALYFLYFYYPRLKRKGKKRFAAIYGGCGLSAVAIFIIFIVFQALTTVTIGDQNFSRKETSVSLSLDIITNNDIDKLKSLKNLESLSITYSFMDDEDVEIISELTGLKKLSLYGNTDITDVSPLNNLTELTFLNLSLTGTKDISCLDKLNNLEELYINSTKVSDISCLSSFPNLKHLEINSLENLKEDKITVPPSLKYLYCSNDNIDSIEFVSVCESLIGIYALDNNISDLSPLEKFDSIDTVDFANNNIADISPVCKDSLCSLKMTGNKIADISPLAGLKNLSTLELGYNQITDISALANKSKLRSVELNNNNISDIESLHECFNIYSLDISHNKVADISVLASIDELSLLTANDNQIDDISVLDKCENLKNTNTLNFSNNRIKDVSVLSEYVNLKYLSLNKNEIEDISPFASCTSLSSVELNHNKISDISSLSKLSNIKVLNVIDNPISDLSCLYSSYAPFATATTDSTSFIDGTLLGITYNDGIDWEKLITVDNLRVSVYDATDRQRKNLYDMGYWNFSTVEEFDAKELEEESSEDGTTEQTTEGENG